MSNYKQLTAEQINLLLQRGCRAEDWSTIYCSDPESLNYIRGVRFSGSVSFGKFTEVFILPGGIKKHSGLRECTLHNVTVGDDSLVENVTNYIANYDIGSHTYIENVDLIVNEGPCSFGNGVEVSVLNETGGREVKIYDRMSAQIAYVLAMYRHRPALIERLNSMIDNYAASQSSERGKIGDYVSIRNTRHINGVRIGDYAVISGTSRLRNGSVLSNKYAPVTIAHGVIADDFIICSGSHVADNTTIERCFVGQACHLGHGYSASDSLFFSNCQGENGEACAIFAGPFTVTHHKSTLLIAGMFSFMNAGSGSNQSNHMYKLGPIHQGVAERGAKTTSDSYLLWPSKIGAFSLVMGRHTHHADTSELPFSYLIENNSESYLVPGANLRTVGTIRDAQKWPKRDNRKDPHKIDQINFNLLSPYTVQKMWRGREVLNELQTLSGENTDVYGYRNCKIRNSSLRHGRELYTIGIQKFLGNSLISRLEQEEWHTLAEIRAALRPDSRVGLGNWVDLAGLIAPKSEVSVLLDDIEKGHMTLEDIQARLVQMHANYYSYEWTWALDKLEQVWGCSVEEVSLEQIRMTVNQWREAVVNLDRMVYNDARKEFDLNSQTGFGVDGDREQAEADFEEVRGSFESNSFVKAVLEHIERKSALGNKILEKLENVRD